MGLASASSRRDACVAPASPRGYGLDEILGLARGRRDVPSGGPCPFYRSGWKSIVTTSSVVTGTPCTLVGA